MSLLINSLYPKLHTLLKKELNIPSVYICDKYGEMDLNGISESYKKLENVQKIINKWKTTNKIKLSKKIDACLSCDALYFKPEVTKTENNEIIGIELTEKDKKKNCHQILQKNFWLIHNFLNRL